MLTIDEKILEGIKTAPGDGYLQGMAEATLPFVPPRPWQDEKVNTFLIKLRDQIVKGSVPS
jgi:hypothetical protein